MDLKGFFNPQSIALVGASEQRGKVGTAIAKNLLELGYAGEVFLVNQKYDELYRKKCYRKLSEIEQTVDLVILAIPADYILGEIEENSDKIKNFVVISAGFSEIGNEGIQRERLLKELSERKGLNILGPNCLGFINPKLKLNASFSSGLPQMGNIAFISQSGALAVALLDIAREEFLGFSKVVSIGNKMQLSEIELLNYLRDDDNTQVIGLYLEGIKNGTEFMLAAKEVSLKKPVVILKAGKTERTQRAISSHTGMLAGSDEIAQAVFRKCGIMSADNLEEFFNLLKFCSLNFAIDSEAVFRKVAVVTNAGGVGVLTSDAFQKKQVELAEIDEETKKRLRKVLPAESSVENPIDLLGEANEERYKKTLRIIGKKMEINPILCLLTPQDQTPVTKIAASIISFKKSSRKIIATSFVGGERVAKSLKKLRKAGICNFPFPELGINTFEKYRSWQERRKMDCAFEVGERLNGESRQVLNGLIEGAKKEGRRALSFNEAKKLMDGYGINTVDVSEIVPGTDLSEWVKYPAVLKVDSDKVLHKTEQGGVVLGIQNRGELEMTFREMRVKFPAEKIILQPMLEAGMELIVGFKRDEIFGSVLVCGLGGIYTEIFKLSDLLLPPFSSIEAERFLLEGKSGFLFKETRGKAAYDLNEMVKLLRAVGDFANDFPQVLEFDINPLLIYNTGKEAVAVDVKIII